MLWSRNNDFICITVTDGEHPRTPALAEYGSGQSMEAAVGHPFLDTGVTDNVHFVPDLKFLDDTGHRRKPALS
jgi:hypothetical protein